MCAWQDDTIDRMQAVAASAEISHDWSDLSQASSASQDRPDSEIEKELKMEHDIARWVAPPLSGNYRIS